MEPVLEVYAEGATGLREVIGLDESGKELQEPVRPSPPGPPVREDPENHRNAQANLLLAYALFRGWRTITVTETRTRSDWAHFVHDLLDHLPSERRITIVLDNLNTYTVAALYQAFPLTEATRIRHRVTFVHIPSTDRGAAVRSPADSGSRDAGAGDRRVVTAQNAVAAPARWTFTNDQARRALTRLYPVPGPIDDTSAETMPG